MAPKKSMRKHPQKDTESFSKEKRSKHREDTSMRKGQMVEELSSSPSSAQKGLSMAMRPIASRRCIIFNFLEELGLELEDRIEEQGWTHFCSLNIFTYPNLDWTFYKNLIVGEEHIESRVKEKRIIISEVSLSSLLHMPHIGNKFLELECRKIALQTIIKRDDVNIIGTILVSSLSLEMRLLHNFISRIFIPMTRRFDRVSERDLAFMKKVIKEEAINLLYIMISQMKETTGKANTCLPYGMVFTLLFEAAHVNLEGEDSRQLHHTDTYSTKSLIRMGYHLSNGQWKKKI